MKGHTPAARSVAAWKNRRRPNRSAHGRAERARRREQAARVKALLAPVNQELKRRAAEREAAAAGVEIRPGSIEGRPLSARERELRRLARSTWARAAHDERRRENAGVDDELVY